MQLNKLQDLLVHNLRDTYSAENQALTGLQQMEKAAVHAELKAAFREHHAQSVEQVKRLEKVFEILGKSPKGVHCKGMQGLVAEAKEMIEEKGDPDVIDAGLISSAQHVEHYEIASYGTAATFAKLLGQTDVLKLLVQTLEEEKAADEKLTTLAKQVINPEAAQQ